MHRTRICKWVVTAFDSSVEDPRDYLTLEYGGLTLHIKPGHGDAASLISVFIEDPRADAEVRLIVNRFLSAMAWKDGHEYVTLGTITSGARLVDKDSPRFNYTEGRVLRYRTVDQFDFEHLQDPPNQKQKLALALYREGLNSNMPFYRLLSFFKIVNIGFGLGSEQKAWINANLGKVGNVWGGERLEELSRTVADVGEYLWTQGRNAIAHAYNEPIKDPDVPIDVLTAKRDSELMEVLAQIFIEDELGVPSLRKIHSEHLYELAGFKELFGLALTEKLTAKAALSVGDFPTIPPLTIGQRVHLTEDLRYDCLTALPFIVASCQSGIVILRTEVAAQPIKACLLLDFPGERLEFILERFGIDGRLHSRAVEICWYRFLIGYFHNGYLRIFNAVSNQRLSHKLAFIPVNIDPGQTVAAWQARISELEGQAG